MICKIDSSGMMSRDIEKCEGRVPAKIVKLADTIHLH